MRENRLSDSIKSIMDSLNVIGGGRNTGEVAVYAFQTSHRTLQQMFVLYVLLPILRHLKMCHENGIYDARNEASCALAAKMLAAVEESDTYLPFI